MLNTFFRTLKTNAFKVREKSKEHFRSPQWSQVRDDFIQSCERCAACGTKNKLQVHHILPFHRHPELELDWSNLIVLCMDVHDCHLNIGHGDSFRTYNPNVIADAKKYFESSAKNRKKLLEEVKRNRLR